jgi:hypothetical protein
MIVAVASFPCTQRSIYDPTRSAMIRRKITLTETRADRAALHHWLPANVSGRKPYWQRVCRANDILSKKVTITALSWAEGSEQLNAEFALYVLRPSTPIGATVRPQPAPTTL